MILDRDGVPQSSFVCHIIGGSNTGSMALPNAAMPDNTGSKKGINDLVGGDGMGSVWAFVALIVLYVIWALVEQHQKIKDQIQPKNIAMNFVNLFKVAIMVIVALGLIKLALVGLGKLNLPGVKPLAEAVEFAS